MTAAGGGAAGGLPAEGLEYLGNTRLVTPASRVIKAANGRFPGIPTTLASGPQAGDMAEATIAGPAQRLLGRWFPNLFATSAIYRIRRAGVFALGPRGQRCREQGQVLALHRDPPLQERLEHERAGPMGIGPVEQPHRRQRALLRIVVEQPPL